MLQGFCQLAVAVCLCRVMCVSSPLRPMIEAVKPTRHSCHGCNLSSSKCVPGLLLQTLQQTYQRPSFHFPMAVTNTLDGRNHPSKNTYAQPPVGRRVFDEFHESFRCVGRSTTSHGSSVLHVLLGLAILSGKDVHSCGTASWCCVSWRIGNTFRPGWGHTCYLIGGPFLPTNHARLVNGFLA